MNEAVPTALAVEQAMYVDAPRERVFELLTNVSEIRRWMPMSAFEPRVGGLYVPRLKTAAEGGDPGPDDLVPRR